MNLDNTDQFAYITGYEDGTVRPLKDITRAEFAAIATRFMSDAVTDDGTGDFVDTAGHWAAKEIRLAAKAGWVRGDGDLFRPDAPITRAEDGATEIWTALTEAKDWTALEAEWAANNGASVPKAEPETQSMFDGI